MFRKVQKQLTLLFFGAAAVLIITMSICLLSISEKSLYTNNRYTFEEDVSTILNHIEYQSVLTHYFLATLEKNGLYTVAILDQSKMLSYSELHTTKDTAAVIDYIVEEYENHPEYKLQKGTRNNATKSFFSYTDENGVPYYVAIANVYQEHGNLDMIILYNLTPLSHQIALQRLRFLVIDILALAILGIFGWFYTGNVLKPIEISQKKQQEFIASASHELRTPLAVMLSSLNAMDKANHDDDKKHFFHAAQNAGEKMNLLLKDMLVLASMDNQSWSIDFKETELDTLVLNCYEAFEAMALEQGLTLQVALPEDTIPTCLCDRNRIEQVISILLHNAFRYCKPHDTVVLALAYHNNQFTLQVIDHGIGISDQDKPHIFERFYRCKESHGSREHFGLGLCIAQEIIHAHHGTITVSDTPGGGTTFTLNLKRM